MHWGHIIPVIFLPQIHHPNLILRKHQEKSKLRDTLQNNWPILSTSVKFIEEKEIWDVSPDWRRPRGQDSCGSQPPRWPLSEPGIHGIGLTRLPIGRCGNDTLWFLKLDHKRLCNFNLTFSGRRQLPCHEATQASLWRDPRGEVARPPALLWISHLDSRSPSLVKTSDDLSPGWHHEYNVIRDPEQELPS